MGLLLRALYSERMTKYGSKKGTEVTYRTIMYNHLIYNRNKKKERRCTGKLFFLLKFFNKSRRF